MTTNPPGYLKDYYRRERAYLIWLLGGKCYSCGGRTDLEFHHIIPLGLDRPNGRLDRLTEWKKNLWNLEILCRSCHRAYHSKH